MTIDTTELATAIATIAKFFHENVTDQDGVITNSMAYPQKKVLNGLCYTATKEAAYTSTVTLRKAMDEMNEALDSHKGDEISDLTVARKLAWVEKVEMQLAHLEAMRTAAMAAYESFTGEKYVHERPKLTAVGDVKVTDAVARARAKSGRPAGGPDTSYNSTMAANEVEHGVREPARVGGKRK